MVYPANYVRITVLLVKWCKHIILNCMAYYGLNFALKKRSNRQCNTIDYRPSVPAVVKLSVPQCPFYSFRNQMCMSTWLAWICRFLFSFCRLSAIAILMRKEKGRFR